MFSTYVIEKIVYKKIYQTYVMYLLIKYIEVINRNKFNSHLILDVYAISSKRWENSKR